MHSVYSCTDRVYVQVLVMVSTAHFFHVQVERHEPFFDQVDKASRSRCREKSSFEWMFLNITLSLAERCRVDLMSPVMSSIYSRKS